MTMYKVTFVRTDGLSEALHFRTVKEVLVSIQTLLAIDCNDITVEKI